MHPPNPAKESATGGERPRPNFRELTAFLEGPGGYGSLAVIGLFLLALVAFLHFAEPVLLPALVALILYFLLKPVVVILHRLRIPRPMGAIVVITILLGSAFTGLSVLQEPAARFVEQAPHGIRKIEEKVADLARRLERINTVPGTNAVSLESARSDARFPFLSRLNLPEALLSYTTLLNTATLLTGLLETIVLLYFLLAAGDRFLETLAGALPGQTDKDEAVAIVNDAQQSISSYLSTITVINACVGILVATAMAVLGMPNPTLWGVIAATLNYMPYFGPLSVFTVIVMAGLVYFPSVGQALLPPLVYLAIHAVESNVITPAILGRRLTLNPLVIFLALMFWTWLWGIGGALLSVPLVMIVKILCDHTRPLKPVGEFLSAE